jgi:hypothetical protein
MVFSPHDIQGWNATVFNPEKVEKRVDLCN